MKAKPGQDDPSSTKTHLISLLQSYVGRVQLQMEVLHYAHGMRCGDLMDRGNNKINAFLYFLSFNIK